MGDEELIKQETELDTQNIQNSIDNIRKYYEGKQNINPFTNGGERKTTEELVNEVIFKLT